MLRLNIRMFVVFVLVIPLLSPYRHGCAVCTCQFGCARETVYMIRSYFLVCLFNVVVVHAMV